MFRSSPQKPQETIGITTFPVGTWGIQRGIQHEGARVRVPHSAGTATLLRLGSPIVWVRYPANLREDQEDERTRRMRASGHVFISSVFHYFTLCETIESRDFDGQLQSIEQSIEQNTQPNSPIEDQRSSVLFAGKQSCRPNEDEICTT